MAEMSYQLCTLLLSKWKRIVCLIPGSEWCAINTDDAVFHQCLCTYQLIVTSIVQYINDACLACHRYKSTSLPNEYIQIYDNQLHSFSGDVSDT